ncbi:PREDICTED: ATPase 3, plasma membrane-type-like [Brassica oleracea var. oleracea]|uniref:ATPase 3, plasma membrane-type-like n=1 Tax=Brassica oleracea var. oleracea TaxID=109376 RepID=UPI0006A6BF30|nr:PREDICTED: ATPase 3, plasma membrane-type-like [Brassica oleracea var. oleracea]
MYPSASASLFSNHKDESLADVPVEQLIENADAFAAVFPAMFWFMFQPEQKYEIVKKLQELKHICSMTGDGCSPALKRANSGIDVAAATDYHQRIVTTQAIFQRIMSYTVSALF